MHNKNLRCKTEDYGFDFSSVYAECRNTAPPAEIHNEFSSLSDEAMGNGENHSECALSIEEIAEELSKASEKALSAIKDAEEDENGITATEVMASSQKITRCPADMPAPTSKAELREQEEQLAIEGLLEQTLQRAQLAVCRNIMWGADLNDRIWKPLQTEAQISNFLHGLGIIRYGNAIRWFSHRVLGNPHFKVPGFFEEANLWGMVSLADGLLDIRSHTFRERAMSDRVTATLRWSYRDLEYAPRYDRLKEIMQSLAVTDEAYLRLQELCGVALHAEPSGRLLYFQHYNPRVASIFTTLLSKVWSEESVTFLGLRDHERSFRTAQVLERPIVISAKEGESTLKDISTVLALVDGDGINTDRKNLEPFDFVSRCSLICAGRNLPSLSKGSMKTLQYYLVRVNLTGDLPDNIALRELLSYTREFITWALEGLRRYISNNGRFTYDVGSEIQREDTSIVNFVQNALVSDPNGKVPSTVLHEAYASYCIQNNLAVLPKPRLITYLKDTFPIESRTVRVPWFNEGQPVFGYVGIRFSEEYQTLLMNLSDEKFDPRLEHQMSDEEDEEYMSIVDDDWQPDFEPCGELIP